LVAGVARWRGVIADGDTALLAAKLLGGAAVPLAILTVGLLLRVPKPGGVLVPVGVMIVLKLLLAPTLAGIGAVAFGLPETWRDVLVLLAGMPPAIIGVVFLRRYGGDSSLASTLFVVGAVASVGSLLLVIYLLG